MSSLAKRSNNFLMPPTSNLISAFLSAPAPSIFSTCPFPKRSCITILPTFNLVSDAELPEPVGGLEATGFNFRIFRLGEGSSSSYLFGGVPLTGFDNLSFDCLHHRKYPCQSSACNDNCFLQGLDILNIRP